MAMISIGQDGWLVLNANEISSIKFTPRGWEGYGARGHETPGSTTIEMRNGTRHELSGLSPEGKQELLRQIQEAQT